FNIGEVSKELLQEKKTFLIKAFNVAPSDFWQNDISSEDIGFGFSISNDPLFKEYLKLSSINLLCLDPEKKLAKDTFALYLVSLYKSLEYKSGDAVNNKDTTYMARSEFVSKIDKITKKFIEDNNIDLKENTDLDMQKYTIHRLLDGLGLDFFIETGMMNSSVSETDIPIYINHDKIPQLSWGHAKYAHYFNDKSFNFFKFKHADHLPVKEEVNSSES
ncbi:MAG: hypothetical protein QG669_80, partial [Patescibacteria group bacterium]|nr:hypothetical protein [Patescibacteria group bacterium]